MHFSKKLKDVYKKQSNEYIDSGFAGLEYAIEETFLKMQKIDVFKVKIVIILKYII